MTLFWERHYWLRHPHWGLVHAVRLPVIRWRHARRGHPEDRVDGYPVAVDRNGQTVYDVTCFDCERDFVGVRSDEAAGT